MNTPTAQTLDTLQRASVQLRSGQHAPARELLGALLRSQPDLADAHWLLAGSFFQTGDLVRAKKELRACIRLRPDHLDAHVQLARALSASGQSGEAMQVLRHALTRNPGHLAAALALARLLLMQNLAEEARCLLEPFADRNSTVPEIWMLYGHALLTLGRAQQAEQVFRRLVQLEPGNDEARTRLAAALVDNEQQTEAEAEVRAVMAKGGTTPEASFVLARALMGQGRFSEAETALRKVIQVQPQHAIAQSNLSELVWMRTGDAVAASAELDVVLHTQPRLTELRIAKARLLLSARRAEDALAVIDAGLSLADHDASLLNAATTIALDFDGQQALAYAHRALRAAPSGRKAQVGMGNALLATGQARQALDFAERLHRLDPADGQALAMQADALRLLDDPRYRDLLDYRHFVRAEFIDTPEGWPDLSAYLGDLASALERAHTLHAHPIGNSLRQGSQVEMTPERSPDAAVRAFPQAIDGPIRRYMEALGEGSDPMRRRNTGRYRFSGMWSVRLRPEGFHVNHYHPQGWIASACYLHLPPSVTNNSGEGWLKFGEPVFPTDPPLEPEYFVKPEPGLLALFPSYMWHGTAPFSGGPDDSRLTIAFDVVPV